MDIEKEFFKLLISKGLTEREARDILFKYFTNLVRQGGENARQSSNSCFSCGGFYAPSFGQPLCSTCHAFLYPDNINFWCNWAHRSKYSDDQKSDSEDSGNEDLGPTVSYNQKDGSNTAVQSPADQSSSSLSLHSFQQSSGFGDENNPLFLGVDHHAAPTDRLAEQLRALSQPRSANDCPLPDGLVDRLPTEVVTTIFGFVDDLTLWCCSRVSKRWQRIVKSCTTSQQWQQYVKQRWPLVQPFYAPVCWYKLYGALVDAAPCFACLERMQIDKHQTNVWAPAVSDTNGVGTSLGSKRLHSEIRSLHAEPPAGVEARPLNRQYSHWLASLTGPANSPYEGGKFFLFIRIPDSYPMVPPTIKFLTRIFHPNVSRHGDIGMDVLLHNWSLALTLSKILLSIQSLLTDPTSEACMEPEIGVLFRENRTVYDCLAQMWTWKFAMIDVLMPSSGE